MATVENTLTADGNTAEYTVVGPTAQPASNWMYLHLSGNFGGGTFQLQIEVMGTFEDFTNGAFTSAVDKKIELKPGTKVRGVLSGATSPSLVYSMR